MNALLGALVRLFPRPFRERYGAAMLDDIERDCERARARGGPHALWCAISIAWDLPRSARGRAREPHAARRPVQRQEGTVYALVHTRVDDRSPPRPALAAAVAPASPP